MSIRPREAIEASHSFSLRDAIGAPEQGVAAAPPQGGLRFNLAGLGAHAGGTAPGTRGRVGHQSNGVWRDSSGSTAAFSLGSGGSGLSLRFSGAGPVIKQQTAAPSQEAPKAGQLQLNFSSMRGSGWSPVDSQRNAVSTKEAANTKADVMRLTAYVDELTTRLRKTQGKLEQTEHQLTRTSQVLCHERQASQATLTGYKKDLAEAHDIEQKLRSEIATSNKKSALREATFMDSVGTALASDEQITAQKRSLQEIETNIKTLGEFKTSLEAEIATIKSLRESAQKELVSVRAAFEEDTAKARVAASEHASARAELRKVNQEHDTIMEHLASAKVEQATVQEALQVLRDDRLQAEEETRTAKQEAQTMLLEHAEIVRKLSNLQQRVKDLSEQESSARAAIDQAEALVKATDVGASSCLASSSGPSLGAQPPLPAQTPVSLKSDGHGGCPKATLSPSPDPTVDMARISLDGNSSLSSGASQGGVRKGAVFGAPAPGIDLCSGVPGCDAAWKAYQSMPNAHTSALVDIDAPVGMTTQRIGFLGGEHCVLMDQQATDAPSQQSDATTLMIQAVVGDLKQKLMKAVRDQTTWREVAPLR
jgi:hypothetical protein